MLRVCVCVWMCLCLNELSGRLRSKCYEDLMSLRRVEGAVMDSVEDSGKEDPPPSHTAIIPMYVMYLTDMNQH